jgi:transcriptional regulator with XRE-family HTH domain
MPFMDDPGAIKAVFGEVLRELRGGCALSQENLAHQANLDRTFISLLERGLRQPTLTSLFALAEQLDTTPSALLRRVEARLKKR